MKKMVKNSNLTDLAKAEIIVNHLMKTHRIRLIIESMPFYDERYTNLPSTMITEFIFDKGICPMPEVKLYSPRAWKFSGAYAKIGITETKKFYINKYKLRRHKEENLNVASLCGTIVHEWGHAAEHLVRETHETVRFNHGDNKRAGKQNTMQYYLGARVKYEVARNYDRLIQEIGIN